MAKHRATWMSSVKLNEVTFGGLFEAIFGAKESEGHFQRRYSVS